MSDHEEDRLDALLSREVSNWYQGAAPRPEFLAELASRDWNRVVSDQTQAPGGHWSLWPLKRLVAWKRLAWASLAGLILTIAVSGLGSRTIRAFLVPPVFPVLEQQTLEGDSGVREGMTVTLRPGPKVFRLVFQAPVENRRGAEAALTELCPTCTFYCYWTNDEELQVYLPKDPPLSGTEATYTVGRIKVQVSSRQEYLWEWDVRSGNGNKVADVTGLAAWSVSPDGRQALLARTSASDRPPSIYVLDLDSGGRTNGTFALSSIWHPDGSPRLIDSSGRILDLQGRVVQQSPGGFAQPAPGGATTDWKERGQSQWDLQVRTHDGRELTFSLPETDDHPPSGTERVHYPLWNLYWSPEGSHLLVVQNRRPPTSTVFLVDTTSGRMTAMRMNLEGSFDPMWMWLPNGEGFAVSESGKTVVFDIQGQPVTSFDGSARSWSPNGGFILFSDRVTDKEGNSLFAIPQNLRVVGWRAEGIVVLQGTE